MAKQPKPTKVELADREDLRAVISTPEGRRFVRRVLASCGMRESTFNTNALVMASNEGRRSVAVWLEGEVIDAGEDHYFRLLKEPDNTEQGSTAEGDSDA